MNSSLAFTTKNKSSWKLHPTGRDSDEEPTVWVLQGAAGLRLPSRAGGHRSSQSCRAQVASWLLESIPRFPLWFTRLKEKYQILALVL